MESREIGGMRFHVVIDGHLLGYWARVEGLSVKFEVAEYRAGDARNRRWIEPAFTTYSNVKLSRATTLEYTKRIMVWLETTAFGHTDVTAQITGFPLWHDSGAQDYVVKWDLRGVIPVAWSGPQFDAGSGKLATETLELAHEGFLPEGVRGTAIDFGPAPMTLNSSEPRFGLTTRFAVVVDDLWLGRWSKCEGLSVTFKLYDYAPLGHNGHIPVLPDRLVYDKVTLTRAVTAEESPLVMKWLAKMAGGYSAGMAAITLMDSHGVKVVSWRLRGVYPTKWKGPSLDASSHNVAVETLELAHEGFLEE